MGATAAGFGIRVAVPLLNSFPIGEMSLIDHQPHSSTCVADDECVVLVMSSRDFATLIATVPKMAHQVMATLSRRLRESDHKLDECLGTQKSP